LPILPPLGTSVVIKDMSLFLYGEELSEHVSKFMGLIFHELIDLAFSFADSVAFM